MTAIRVVLESGCGPLVFEAHSPAEECCIATYGDERPFLDYFLSRLEPDDTVFDIGANIGLFTLHAATRLYGGQVFAFEPDPEIRLRLRHNHGLNPGLRRCHFVDWAVSDRQGEATLFSRGLAGRSPSLRHLFGDECLPGKEIPVRTVCLDEAIVAGELPLPDVLKIDVEGAEVLCLRGASGLLGGLLGKPPRLLFLENHPDYLPCFGSDASELSGLLQTAGYSPVWQMERFNQSLCCFEKVAEVV